MKLFRLRIKEGTYRGLLAALMWWSGDASLEVDQACGALKSKRM
jgi:hypothetical protein